jgi:predicted transcriptional regulator of viral defense system
MFGVVSHKRSGVELRVTNLQKTFVDVLDRPDLTGRWEEIWRSLESVEFFDLDQVVECVLLLESATTAAKVGFLRLSEPPSTGAPGSSGRGGASATQAA